MKFLILLVFLILSPILPGQEDQFSYAQASRKIELYVADYLQLGISNFPASGTLSMALYEEDVGKISAGAELSPIDLIGFTADFSISFIVHCNDELTGPRCNTRNFSRSDRNILQSIPIVFLSDYETEKISPSIARFREITPYDAAHFNEEQMLIVAKIASWETGAALRFGKNYESSLDYVSGKGGLGCSGTYRVELFPPDSADTTLFQGPIEEIFLMDTTKFETRGTYRIHYEIIFTECFAFFTDERRDGTSFAHPYMVSSKRQEPLNIKFVLRLRIY